MKKSNISGKKISKEQALAGLGNPTTWKKEAIELKKEFSMKPAQILYVVGKVLDVNKNNWEIVGVFDTEQKAKRACIKQNYFIGPVELNYAAPDEPVAWVGAYYPFLK